jgi:hypothetical protein
MWGSGEIGALALMVDGVWDILLVWMQPSSKYTFFPDLAKEGL